MHYTKARHFYVVGQIQKKKNILSCIVSRLPEDCCSIQQHETQCRLWTGYPCLYNNLSQNIPKCVKKTNDIQIYIKFVVNRSKHYDIFVKHMFKHFLFGQDAELHDAEHECVRSIEKGIRIEYPYNFGLPLGNSAFVTIWLEFDLLVRTIVQI